LEAFAHPAVFREIALRFPVPYMMPGGAPMDAAKDG